MQNKRLTFESILPDEGSSFKVLNIRNFKHCQHYWHYHPEYEIVFTTKKYGKRQIGNHLTFYEEGDLVLIGPNLPHLSFGSPGIEGREVVVQFSGDWWQQNFGSLIELQPIQQLLKKAECGIAFYGKAKKQVGKLMLELADSPSMKRLVILLQVLENLAISDESELLNQVAGWTSQQLQQQQKLSTIFEYVEQHYQHKISLKDLADLLHMTESSFSRYFQRNTQIPCMQYINSVRIRKVCQQLTHNDLLISTIAFEQGFDSLPYFNRVFKKIMQQTPKNYRQKMRL